MFTSKWRLVYVCLAIGLIGLGCAWYIVHVYDTPSKAFGDAPPPVNFAGAFQFLVSFLAGIGFTGSSFVMALMNWWKTAHPPVVNPVTPNTPSNNKTVIPEVLPDLLEAFPEWIADRSNRAKARRFWFDLCELGIESDPDPDTKAWLQQGSEILRKKFFPEIKA